MRSLRIAIFLGALCLLASAQSSWFGNKKKGANGAQQTPPAATGSNPKTKTVGTAGHHVRQQNSQPILS